MSTLYQPRYRESWALIIGVNEYQFVSPLQYACNDADAVASALTAKLGFPEKNVRVLKDREATRQGIATAFLDFADSTDREDRLIVFYAGHGMTVPGVNGPVGFLIPVDGDPRNKASLLRWDSFTRDCEIIQAKHILFIMDACYSGLAMQRAVPATATRFVSDMLQRRSRQVITAGKANQTVADGGGPEGKNSVFTGHLVEGLCGQAADKDGVLTGSGLMHYVYERVSRSASSAQTPNYGHIDGDGDFVLATPDAKHLNEVAGPDFVVATVPERPEPEAPPQQVIVPQFAVKSGYANPDDANFGRNEWTQKLGSVFHRDSTETVEKAKGWLSITAEPVTDHRLSIDIAKEAKELPREDVSANKNPWEQFQVPREAITTYSALLLVEAKRSEKEEAWHRFVRIDRHGNIEHADHTNTFWDLRNGYRPMEVDAFRYVQVVGTVWQFIFFVKKLLWKYAYRGGVRLTVNLVGTRGSVLIDYAEGQGKDGQKWRQPFDPMGSGTHDVRCREANLQIPYDLTLANFREPEALRLALDLSHQIGLAYNHQSEARCFNYGTEVFPWNEFLYRRHL